MSINTNTATVNSIEGGEQVDRDIPGLTATKKQGGMKRLAIAGAMIVAVAVVATGCAMFMQRLEAKKEQQRAEKAKERPKEAPAETKDFDSAKRRIKQEDDAKLPPPAGAVDAAATAAAIPVTGTANAAGSGTPAPGAAGASGAGRPAGGTSAAGGGTQNGQASGAPVLTAKQRRMSGDVLVDTSASLVMPVTSAPGTSNSLGARDGGTPPKNGFDEKLKPSQLIAGVAAQRPDLSFLLRRGTAIPCVGKTKIITTQPGMVSCVVSKDVYSADGKVLLVERGSEAFGENREPLAQGQSVTPVLWSRIDTPKGVAIDINSLGTDPLGASGQPIFVDNHLMQRFGGAVMLSLISDVGHALSNRASDGQGTVQLTTTSTAGQDLATKTLENTINIPPTGYSLQGAAMVIFVARDMDFRSVYELARY